MNTPLENKSTPEEIRAHFDADVERFSNLETGQQTTMDAALVLDLVARIGGRQLQPLKPDGALLDLGCGAGNFTLRMLSEAPGLHCHLADLSGPMLARARERVGASGQAASIATHQGDFRALEFASASFDAILAGATLHHLREEADWRAMFANLRRWLKPGGRLYVWDLVWFDLPDVQALMWARWSDYLAALGGPEFRDKIFAIIDKEDSPRSLPFQLELLRASGFSRYDVLHRNCVFACYVGVA